LGLEVGDGPEEARRVDEALRAGDPAVIGRLVNDRLFLDCRTVLPAQVGALAAALAAAAP
jgi:L-seryl-tRNA(Ser) seleniumtransferase